MWGSGSHTAPSCPAPGVSAISTRLAISMCDLASAYAIVAPPG